MLLPLNFSIANHVFYSLKKLLKRLIEELTLSLNRLMIKLKSYMINKVLSNVLHQLIDIKNEKISDVELLNEKLFFRYLGGKFFIVPKIVSNNTNTVYLTVYHETPLAKDNIKPVEDFYLEVDILGNLKITNCLNKNQLLELLKTVTQSIMITVYPNEFSSTFVKHFEAKMKSEPFEINPS